MLISQGLMERVVRLISIVLVGIGLGCALLWLPEWMANQYHFAESKDWASQVTANRAMLVNLLGGLAVAITIYFTYRNFKVAQENLKLAADKSITDTYSKAVEQLGNTDMSVRLGGIHALARIARSSQSDYFSVMQVLTGLLRNRYRAPHNGTSDASTAPGESRCPIEAQVVSVIVGDRYWPDPAGYSLDLSYLELCDAWVPRADFHNVYFWYVKFTGWNFGSANLRGADFKGAVLRECDFTDADLTGANFEDATILAPKGLTRAQLSGAEKVNPASFGSCLM
jgi:hypothetical protein